MFQTTEYGLCLARPGRPLKNKKTSCFVEFSKETEIET